MDLRVEPVEWEMTYPVHPHDPIGRIRRRRNGFHAKLGEELIGVYRNGDRASEAIWDRFVERSYVEHDAASRVHGSHERG